MLSILFFLVLGIGLVLTLIIPSKIEKHRLNKRLEEILGESLSFLQRKKYRRSLKELDFAYTKYTDFMELSPSGILDCPEGMSYDLKHYYEEACERYADQDIREDALERIYEYLNEKYLVLTIKNHYLNIRNNSNKTIELMKEKDRTYKFSQRLTPLYKKRIMYLYKVKQYCNKLIYQLDENKEEYESAISQLQQIKKIKKPTLMDVATHILTAPLRHTLNVVNGVVQGRGDKLLESAPFIGLSILGVGSFSEAFDALEGIESMDLEEINNLPEEGAGVHLVEAHERHLPMVLQL